MGEREGRIMVSLALFLCFNVFCFLGSGRQGAKDPHPFLSSTRGKKDRWGLSFCAGRVEGDSKWALAISLDDDVISSKSIFYCLFLISASPGNVQGVRGWMLMVGSWSWQPNIRCTDHHLKVASCCVEAFASVY